MKGAPTIQATDTVIILRPSRARILEIFTDGAGRLAELPLSSAERDYMDHLPPPDCYAILSVNCPIGTRLMLAVEYAGKWQTAHGEALEIVASPQAQDGARVTWPTTVGAMRCALAEFPPDMPIRIPVKWQDDDDDQLETFRVWKHLEQVLISP